MATGGADSKAPSIRFLIPYFGTWPFWMPYYLESCRRNPSISWLFFTDCGVPADSPPNVDFIETSFDKYCSLVSVRLKIKFCPKDPYKLCDIKPALGYVHQEYLNGFDFWAFGDIDVIYGSLRGYFTAQRLAEKDLLATHYRRVSGHLCIVRNNETMRRAFKLIPRWQQRFEDTTHHALDEGAFSRIFIRNKNWPEWLRRFAARFNKWNRLSEFEESHSTFTQLADGSKVIPEQWFWRQGHLTNSVLGEQELPYMHFMVWKNNPQWKKASVRSQLRHPDISGTAGWLINSEGWRAIKDQAPRMES
ncbi:MAG TPA: hypothetical protein ENI17_18000 [Pseudomonas xinjiangensis]|uniref:Uncharacterized protein n=2 Tax=root TaxID=1 RepID=A0A7V1FSV1_9GAMM|nr:hypothetical protein [Halopseudomonas xinjiangensis]HEC49499.1 hypothetical protein [Halopseudomonas xinjiangensis]